MTFRLTKASAWCQSMAAAEWQDRHFDTARGEPLPTEQRQASFGCWCAGTLPGVVTRPRRAAHNSVC